MGLMQLRCPLCNSDKLEARTINGTPGYFCAHCGKEFYEEVGIREYEKLEAMIKSGLGSVVDEALLNSRMETYYNLRSLLFSKITAKYIDSPAIVNICRDILAIAQHDFLAEFFELANSGNKAEIAEYISKINENENALLIDLVLDFIIKSLEEEYITPTAALLDRCAKIFSPEKKQEYLTRFEGEVKKVAAGIYETSLDRDVFLAYSSKDMPAVIDVLNYLESNGISCFAAFRNLQHGRDAVLNYERALEDAINHCSIFLFVSSVNSRNLSCDAFKKEMAYIRNTEMANHPECRSYGQLPAKYRKLRVEYRLDNKQTPFADKTMKEFFAGLTYAENYEQLTSHISECFDILSTPYSEETDTAPAPHSEPNPSFNMSDPEAWAKMIRMINEENKRAEEEAKHKAAETEAKRKAEEEAKRKAAEAEAKRKAEEEAKRKAELEKNFTIEGTTLIKYIGDDSEVVIPNFITTIGEKAFYKYESLTSVTIPNSVTTIGYEAFSCCSSLVSVTIPDSVTSIGDYAFSDCSNLANVTMPDSVTSIGEWAFYRCRSLVSVTIPNSVTSIGSSVFCFCSSLTSVTIPDSVTSIGDMAFARCDNLANITVDKNNKHYKDIDGNLYTKDGKTLIQYAVGKKDAEFTISYGVKGIGNFAFSSCSSLTSVTIPDSVTSIGNGAFLFCSKLTSVTIPDSVTGIGRGVFTDCFSLTSVTIPDSVTSIGDDVFARCKNLANITVDKNNKHYKDIDGNLYTKDGKTLIQYAVGKKDAEFTIPYGVKGIGNLAFYYCSSLTSVTIPDSVTSIGKEAFRDCKNLVIYLSPKANTERFAKDWNCGFEVVLRESKIDQNFTIEGTTLIKYIGDDSEVVIPNFITTIGEKAFSSCSSLASVTIPNSVTTIGYEAFLYCDSLTSITIPSSVTSIGNYAFYHCSSLTSIIVDASNKKYKSIDGNLYTKDGKTLIQYAIGKKDTTFIIPDGVTSIDYSAFYYCSSLTSITIPSSVTSIGNYAFSNCDSLATVIFEENNKLTSIGDEAFKNCNKNLKIYLHPNVDISILGKKWHCGYPFFNSETKKPFTLGGAIRNLFKK